MCPVCQMVSFVWPQLVSPDALNIVSDLLTVTYMAASGIEDIYMFSSLKKTNLWLSLMIGKENQLCL